MPTTKELIRALSALPPDAPVLVLDTEHETSISLGNIEVITSNDPAELKKKYPDAKILTVEEAPRDDSEYINVAIEEHGEIVLISC